MRQDQAEKLSARIQRDDPGREVRVTHVRDGAPEPYGFAVYVDGRNVSSPAAWVSMQSPPDDEPYAFSLRVPQSLADELRALAERNHRSLNAEITVALEQYARQ